MNGQGIEDIATNSVRTLLSMPAIRTRANGSYNLVVSKGSANVAVSEAYLYCKNLYLQ